MIKLNSTFLTDSEKQQFGGEYSFLGKWARKGIGSSRIAYEKGISEIDNWRISDSSKAIFVNFELLKNGLILRFNQNTKNETFGTKISEIKQIHLIGYRVKVKFRKFKNIEEKIVFRGELRIKEQNNEFKFSVLAKDFKEIKLFFKKNGISQLFKHEISNEPIEDDGTIGDYMYLILETISAIFD
jgi:hypothetical protein